MMEEGLWITLLGTGSSSGVPRIGNDWGACDPGEPRNRRMRCGALVERCGANGGVTQVLVDTSPDLREQALKAGLRRVDAVVYTHDHADQSHGIDDLRALAGLMRQRIPVHADAVTAASLEQRFSYCFKGMNGYPAILAREPELQIGQAREIGGEGGSIAFLPVEQDHGAIRSLGFRIGEMAYCNDVVGWPEATFRALQGTRVLIVDALRKTPHPSHAHLALALQWIQQVQPELAILTNLHIDMDYRQLERELPPGVVPGYDGIQVGVLADGAVKMRKRPGWPEV